MRGSNRVNGGYRLKILDPTEVSATLQLYLPPSTTFNLFSLLWVFRICILLRCLFLTGQLLYVAPLSFAFYLLSSRHLSFPLCRPLPPSCLPPLCSRLIALHNNHISNAFARPHETYAHFRSCHPRSLLDPATPLISSLFFPLLCTTTFTSQYVSYLFDLNDIL